MQHFMNLRIDRIPCLSTQTKSRINQPIFGSNDSNNSIYSMQHLINLGANKIPQAKRETNQLILNSDSIFSMPYFIILQTYKTALLLQINYSASIKIL
jgi:hypothetical protein